MTNKESLQFIIDTFNQYANKPDDIGLFFKFYDAHKQLEKALEILEILKNHLEIYDTCCVDEDGDDIFNIRLNVVNSIEYRDIVRWLNNDK